MHFIKITSERLKGGLICARICYTQYFSKNIDVIKFNAEIEEIVAREQMLRIGEIIVEIEVSE